MMTFLLSQIIELKDSTKITVRKIGFQGRLSNFHYFYELEDFYCSLNSIDLSNGLLLFNNNIYAKYDNYYT
jgi:hypothetical protein